MLKDCLEKHGVEGGLQGLGYFCGSRRTVWDNSEANL